MKTLGNRKKNKQTKKKKKKKKKKKQRTNGPVSNHTGQIHTRIVNILLINKNMSQRLLLTEIK